MSKTAKIILIVALAMLPVGIVLAVLGLRFGGRSGFGLDVANMNYVDRTNMIEETVDLEEFDSLRMEITSADVIFTTGDSCRVHYLVQADRKPEITQSGSSLTITQPLKSSFFMGFGYQESDRFEITVPAGNPDVQLAIVATSGDIMISKVGVSGEIKLTSGDIELRDFDGDALNIGSTSGSVNVSGVNLNALTLKSQSGDSLIENGKIGNLSIERTSGEVVCNGLEAEEIYAKSTSGDVDLYDVKADRIECRLTSGEVNLVLNGSEEEYDFDLSATSGDIEINGSEKEDNYVKEAGGDRKVTAKATSGDINILFK
ncbi:MAG: DUF4097 domain-containing protein [Lachnospiraceae bacterium]|nr:DUF4097 domain-containing protein [Lachnospiraceae bacterium]